MADKKQKLGPNQRKWLKALESGKFAQGTGDLRKGDAYCCLGVAAELFKTPATNVHVTSFGKYEYDGRFSVAPTFVIGALGLFTGVGDMRGGGCKLAVMNDDGRTFAEIAEHIRKNPANYFAEPK